MAEAFAKKHGLNAQSAGTVPAKQVNPIVVQAMKEKRDRRLTQQSEDANGEDD
jgi:protein-tyrosine-phosphatase